MEIFLIILAGFLIFNIFAMIYNVTHKREGVLTEANIETIEDKATKRKIIVYDGSTGQGKILLLEGGSYNFNVESWGTNDDVPEIGQDVIIKDDRIFINKRSKMIHGATSSVAHGMGTGIGIIILLVIILILFFVILVF